MFLLAASAAVAKEVKLKDWGDGPVRYLLSEEEAAAWKRLKTDPEREAFIGKFWADRDPTPGTPVNELFDSWPLQVEEANRLFTGEGRPGWNTDRGHAFLLFGPADEVIESEAPAADGQGRERGRDSYGFAVPTAQKSKITWVYHKPPAPDLKPDTKFIFRPDMTGAYKFDQEFSPSWVKFVVARPIGQRATAAPPVHGAARPAAATGSTELKKRLLEAAAGTGGAPALKAQAMVFPAGEKVLVAVTFTPEAAQCDGPGELKLLAGVFGDGDKTVHAAAMPVAPEACRAGTVLSFDFFADPGSYRAGLILDETATGQARGAAALALAVPAFGDGKLRLTAPLLTTSLEVEPGKQLVVDDLAPGLAVGNVRIGLAPGNRFARGASPELFYIVAGARPNAAGALEVTADYLIFQGSEKKSSFPSQAVAGTVNAQPIPLASLEPGEYRLEVTLTETASGAKATESVAFVVQ